MKNLFIVGNWKANKTEKEAIEWLSQFSESIIANKISLENKQIVICSPYHLLKTVYDYIKKNNLNLSLGSQDVSRFKEGSYTGEIPVSLIGKYISFSIIGHSERRRYFKEDDEILQKKVLMTLSLDKLPIYCVENSNVLIPEDVKIVAYEPIEAIGTGNSDNPQNADKTAFEIKNKSNQVSVLYGGSVNSSNVKSFTELQNIDGVLVGAASLDCSEFIKIIENS